jgi:putative ABC transport system permease protein
MGVRLSAGRGLTEHDGAGHPQVLLVNRTLARSGILGPNPIGKQVYALGNSPWEVVGIVEDVHQFGLDREADPQIYVDFRQQPPPTPNAGPGPPPAPYFVVRTTGDPFAVASSLRALVQELEPQATVDNINTLEQIVSNSLLRPRLYALVLGVFAGVAVALAAIGIYGVMAYSVAQRTREIGIRMALGARRGNVMALVLVRSVALTSAGMAAGLLGAAAVTRYLEAMLFGVTPLDPATFAAVALLFAVVALFASYVPARRATNVNPLVALRCE